MGNLRKAVEDLSLEYRFPGSIEERQESRALDSLKVSDSAFEKKFRGYTESPEFSEILESAFGDVLARNPKIDQESLFDAVDARVNTYLEMIGKEKVVNRAVLGAGMRAGAAANRSTIQPEEENIALIQAGKEWYPNFDENKLISNIINDTSLGQDQKQRLMDAHLNDTWEKLSPDDAEIVFKKFDEHLIGPPHKATGWFEKGMELIGTTGRAAVGAETGLLTGLAAMDNAPVVVPPEGERAVADRKWEEEDQKYREMISSGAALQAPIKVHETPNLFGMSMKNIVSQFANDPGKIGKVLESARFGMERGWDRPNTPEADLAGFLVERLDRYKQAARIQAIKETGIEEQQESSLEQETLNERTKEITLWLLKRDMGAGMMEHPVMTQIISSLVLDPINWATPILRIPGAVLRGVSAIGSKLPGAAGKMLGGAYGAAEEVAGIVGKYRRFAGRKIMEGTGFGHVPESIQFEDVAANAPELAKEAREMRYIQLGAPGRAVKLQSKEYELWKILEKKIHPLDVNTRKLLFKSRNGTPEEMMAAREQLFAMKSAKVDDAQRSLTELADKHFAHLEETNQARAFSEKSRMLEDAGRVDPEYYAPRIEAADSDETSWMAGVKSPRTRDISIGPRSAHRRTADMPSSPLVDDIYEAWRRTLKQTTGRESRAAVTVSTVMKHATDRGFAKVFQWDDPVEATHILDNVVQEAKSSGSTSVPDNIFDMVDAAYEDEKGARHLLDILANSSDVNASKAGNAALRLLSARKMNDAARVYAEIKTASTGVEWGAMDAMVARELKDLGGTAPSVGGGVTGVTDYIRRVIGEGFNLPHGKALMVGLRPLARQTTQEIMFRGSGPAANLLNGMLTLAKPFQGIARAAWTVPSFAFQVSQIMTTPFTSFIALGPKGLNPLLHYDATRYAWYSLLKREKGWEKIPGITGMLGRDVEKIGAEIRHFRDGEGQIGKLIDFLIDHGELGTHKARFGIDTSANVLERASTSSKAIRHLAHAGDYIRQGLDDVYFKPFYFMNDMIDSQQKIVTFLGAVKNPNDINDLYRALEFTRRWAIGNISGTGIGPTEQAIKEIFGFYGFTRWAHQWFARMLANPDHLRWLSAYIKTHEGMERAWGGQYPVYAEGVEPGMQHMITAPPGFQMKNQKGPGPHEFAMMQFESPLTLVKSIVDNIQSLVQKHTLNREASIRMLGPAAQGVAGILFGFDPTTGKPVDIPWFPNDTTSFVGSKVGQFAITPFARPVKEIMDIWRYADPKTPLETMDLATKLAARNSGKFFSVIARYLTTGEIEDMEWFEYALMMGSRMYVNSPLWDMVRRKREADEMMRSVESQTKRNLKNVPAKLYSDSPEQILMEMNQ